MSNPITQNRKRRWSTQKRYALLVIAPVFAVLFGPQAQPTLRADAWASYRVIVHPSNPLTATTREYVAQAFFKRTTRWDTGMAMHPVDLRPESAVRRSFSGGILNRSVGAVRSYWQQRIFSGRDLPPPELESDDAVVRYVATSPGAIGYVSGAAKLGSTKEISVR